MSLALPKPLKCDRKRTKVDTSELALAKSHFPRSAEYRAWIRTHRCLLHWFSRCDGDVEAAHVSKGGTGVKGSDYSCIPLCGRNHHRLLDGNSLDFEVLFFLQTKRAELAEEWLLRRAKPATTTESETRTLLNYVLDEIAGIAHEIETGHETELPLIARLLRATIENAKTEGA